MQGQHCTTPCNSALHCPLQFSTVLPRIELFFLSARLDSPYITVLPHCRIVVLSIEMSFLSTALYYSYIHQQLVLHQYIQRLLKEKKKMQRCTTPYDPLTAQHSPNRAQHEEHPSSIDTPVQHSTTPVQYYLRTTLYWPWTALHIIPKKIDFLSSRCAYEYIRVRVQPYRLIFEKYSASCIVLLDVQKTSKSISEMALSVFLRFVLILGFYGLKFEKIP